MHNAKGIITGISSCVFNPPVEFERGTHRKQHKRYHCVTNGNLCSCPRDDVINKLVRWRAQEVWSHIVPYLRKQEIRLNTHPAAFLMKIICT